VYQLATEVPGLDAIVFGHSHQALDGARVSDVLFVQPKNWGMSLAVLDFDVEAKEGGGWRVRSKNSRLVPVTASIAADPEILRLGAPYHEITERFLKTDVARAARSVDASKSRIEDTAIIDAIHAVQLHYAKADVSFTSSFNPRAAIPEGPISVRQIAALYVYDNELYAIEGDGRMVKQALENAARFYNSCPTPECSSGPLINRSVIGYNYDMAQGVSYELDLTQPPGQRVRHLVFRGKPLADDQKLRIAVNNYRAGGSGGYTMFRGAPVVWRSYEDLRELIIRYFSAHPFPSSPDDNWRVVPEPARRVLESEIRREGTGAQTQ
jgi:2',3'-cyclic-nucleotide 2'-phosphodiesterase/3'-nucleotidase